MITFESIADAGVLTLSGTSVFMIEAVALVCSPRHDAERTTADGLRFFFSNRRSADRVIAPGKDGISKCSIYQTSYGFPPILSENLVCCLLHASARIFRAFIGALGHGRTCLNRIRIRYLKVVA